MQDRLPVFSIELAFKQWLLLKNTNVLSENFLSQKENTAEDLADVLETTYPEQRGFSFRSIKRFCKEKEIKCRENCLKWTTILCSWGCSL